MSSRAVIWRRARIVLPPIVLRRAVWWGRLVGVVLVRGPGHFYGRGYYRNVGARGESSVGQGGVVEWHWEVRRKLLVE